MYISSIVETKLIRKSHCIKYNPKTNTKMIKDQQKTTDQMYSAMSLSWLVERLRLMKSVTVDIFYVYVFGELRLRRV